MAAVFITGVTGNIGSRVAKEYLACTDRVVFVLARGTSQEHAEERVREVLTFWDVSPRDIAARVRVLWGDICKPRLGLTSEQITALTKEVSQVIHSASTTRLNLPLSETRESILGGTKNLFQICKEFVRLDRFGYLSTLEVTGECQEIVREEFLTRDSRRFLNTYEEAKFETEDFLRKEIQAGAPVTVFRPTLVVGEAATGKALGFQSFYLMLEKLLLAPPFPVVPRGGPIDVFPVDTLARGIVTLMDYPEANGKVYHFAQGTEGEVSFDEFLTMVAPLLEDRLGRAVKYPRYLSPGVFRSLFTLLRPITSGNLRRSLEVQLIFLEFLSVSWKWNTREMQRALAALNVDLPRFEDFLPRLLDYYFSRREENRLPF